MTNHYTSKELEHAGIIKNPKMWLGGGWFFCKNCRNYTHHYARTTGGGNADCWEVCKICETYNGPNCLDVGKDKMVD